MRTKNHIKNKRATSGKLGWTEAGKVHGTLKRLSATVEPRPSTPGKNAKDRCPYCGRRVTVKNGKFTPHNISRFMSIGGPCDGSKTYVDMREIVSGQLDSHTSAINGTTVRVGDIVSYNATGTILSQRLLTKTIGKIFTSPKYKHPRFTFVEDGPLVWGTSGGTFSDSTGNHKSIESYLIPPYYLKPIS